MSMVSVRAGTSGRRMGVSLSFPDVFRLGMLGLAKSEQGPFKCLSLFINRM